MENKLPLPQAKPEAAGISAERLSRIRPALQSFWTSLDADQQARLSAIMQSAPTNAPLANAH